MRRALIIVSALAMALAIAVLGCEEAPAGVVVWHSYEDGGGEARALTEIATRFEKERGVRVTLLRVAYAGYLAKLEAAIPRGNGPDVFLGPHDRLGEYILHLLVADVADAMPEADVAAFDPSTVDAITYRGHRYAVPLAKKGLALYRNVELVPDAPDTLEAIAARKPLLPAGVWPLAYPTTDVFFHVALLHGYGGALFEDERFAMVGPAAERAAAKVRDLTDTGIVPRSPDGALVTQLFANGKAATAIGGSWLANDLTGRVRYAVSPLPRIGDGGRMRSYLTVEAAFLTPTGARSADARAFARFLGSSETASVRAERAGHVVANEAFWSSEAAKAPSLELARAFREALRDAIPSPVSTAMNPAWEPAKQALLKVVGHDLEPRAALEQAKARYDDVMRPPPKEPTSPAPLAALAGLALLLVTLSVVRRATQPGFRHRLRAGAPAYKYVVHSALALLVLVVLPLVAGALTSLYAGTPDDLQFVGLKNYVDILTVRGRPIGDWLSSGSFYLTLLVTVVWTVANVTLHLAIGLVLGLALAQPVLRLRAVYRVLLILPWAVPSYVTALAWKGMFEQQYGAINALLRALGGSGTTDWFASFSTAFTANVATNVWLGFPFMMVVVMGALTSIPKDVLEAAEVDGATRWQAFWRVTLPLLKPTLLPAVVLGSVWTFNMFNVVFLVSGGSPDGTTDILVSEAYRWAFTRGSQLGYAAAYAVIIFGLLVIMTRVLGGREERA